MSFLLHWTGGDNPAGPIYSEYSGFLGILLPPIFSALAALAIIWWHTRCHISGCLNHGKHPFEHYKLCSKHHPDVPHRGLTHLHIVQLHKGKRNGEHTGAA